nr:integrase, catalytic region, zinc finger, CCHC-type, peptidase aspartic, catalytic [Tanacetum cinerariifolium]
MLLEGSELTKEDRESQLYDELEHFRQHKGESIHDYYVRYAKLINDMRNIKMTMSRMQLNSKFVNNMLPEWVDPLTLMSNVSNPQRYSPSSSTLSSTQVPQPIADNPHLDSSLSPAKNLIKNLTNTLALLTQSYKTFLPQTNNQLQTSSNARNQATVQDGRVVVQNVQGRQNRGQGMNPRGESAAGYGGAQNRVGNVNPGQARPADDCDAFDSDVDEALTAQTMFMANLSSNPLCLTRAKQVQPALYNGHEIIKDKHAPAIVHNTEDTLEIAEITRKKINAKMNDPECVTRKVKIAPQDYSKEKFLATFTTQKQLTPEQIFWSNDLIKLKSEALKEKTTVFRPIKALTVLVLIVMASTIHALRS